MPGDEQPPAPAGWRGFMCELRHYPRWLQALLLVSAVGTLTALLTLMLLYPDQPIRPLGSGHVGKYGAAHTAQDYAGYLLLSRLLLLSGLALFAALVAGLYFRQPPGGRC